MRIAIPCQGLWEMRSNSLTPHSDIPKNFDYFWYHDLNEDECEQVRKTLYGIVTVIRPGPTGAASLDYLYLTFSEFYRYPQLVGAVYRHRQGGLLFPNVLSHTGAEFRSRLFALFMEHNAVWDPVEPETRGSIYVADCPGSRNHRHCMTAAKTSVQSARQECFAVTSVALALLSQWRVSATDSGWEPVPNCSPWDS